MKQLPAATGCAQAPERQISLVQAMLSEEHAVASALFVTVHPPTPSHVDAAWHSAGVQAYAVPPHAPLVHLSFFEQATPSSQLVPLGAAGLEHAPVAGLHVPGTWQESDAAHVTGLAPMHVPA